MAQENDLQTLRDELKKIQDQMRRSRRRAAIGFTVLILALVMSFAYAFVQEVAATRNAEEALRQHLLAQDAQMQADRNAEEARKQQIMANEQRSMAEGAIREVQAELERCRKGRK